MTDPKDKPKKQNKFGAAITQTSKEDISDRFSTATQAEQKDIIQAHKTKSKRNDYKGGRKVASFRLSTALLKELRFLAFISGEDQGSICTEALEALIQKRLDEAKNEQGDKAYNQLLKLFEQTQG